MTELRLHDHDVIGIRAGNPSALTLSGTNSWIVGREPAWLIDPGPQLDEHLDALDDELDRRGGLGGIVLTHDHFDHAEGLAEMRGRHPGATAAAARGDVDTLLAEGDLFGPLRVLALPGHAPDHLVFLLDRTAFTGDAVLGAGSVFISPDPGALSAYLAGLERLRQLRLAAIFPGHGPVIDDPEAMLTQYIAHRLEREQRLVDALAQGRRTVEELLDGAWSDAPAELRPAAALTLAAHLDKLDEEGRLPGGVERPRTA